jgi:hypothetical protein
MTQNQLVGIILLVVAVVDTAVGHLLVAPRIPDERKRNLLKVVFSATGACLGALGFALYLGLVTFWP